MMAVYTRGHNKETANMSSPLLGASVQSREKEQTRYDHSNLQERREHGGWGRGLVVRAREQKVVEQRGLKGKNGQSGWAIRKMRNCGREGPEG